jgi:hypothetical protein
VALRDEPATVGSEHLVCNLHEKVFSLWQVVVSDFMAEKDSGTQNTRVAEA